MSKPFITRFAPSPTGFLHLGHGYSALLAFKSAKKNQGRSLLRMEDIDTTRCKLEFEDAIYRDLSLLKISWETPVRRQSEHFEDYQKALDHLQDLGVLYPCFCTRSEIAQEISKSNSAPHGPEGPLYPGTCRLLSSKQRKEKENSGIPFAIRLDVQTALGRLKGGLTFSEKGKEVTALPQTQGDVVLARKDTPTSYHLSVVVDDAIQKITHIIRGEDLLHTTHIHCLLQSLLGFETPLYHHHGLLVGEDGKRFTKRDRSLTLESLAREGKTLPQIERLISLYGGDLSEVPF